MSCSGSATTLSTTATNWIYLPVVSDVLMRDHQHVRVGLQLQDLARQINGQQRGCAMEGGVEGRGKGGTERCACKQARGSMTQERTYPHNRKHIVDQPPLTRLLTRAAHATQVVVDGAGAHLEPVHDHRTQRGRRVEQAAVHDHSANLPGADARARQQLLHRGEAGHLKLQARVRHVEEEGVPHQPGRAGGLVAQAAAEHDALLELHVVLGEVLGGRQGGGGWSQGGGVSAHDERPLSSLQRESLVKQLQVKPHCCAHRVASAGLQEGLLGELPLRRGRRHRKVEQVDRAAGVEVAVQHHRYQRSCAEQTGQLK